jgi:hypothetical protein
MTEHYGGGDPSEDAFWQFAEGQLDDDVNPDADADLDFELEITGLINHASGDADAYIGEEDGYPAPDFINDYDGTIPDMAWHREPLTDIPGEPFDQTYPFTQMDKDLADQLLAIFRTEAQDEGLIQEFQSQPEATLINDRSEEHLANIDQFVDRIRRFGIFVYELDWFIERPVSEVVTSQGEEFSIHVVEHNISMTEVEAYERFYNAIVDYIGVLLQWGPCTPEADKARQTVAQIIDPDSWREAGASIPDDAQPLPSSKIMQYLETLIDQPLEPRPPRPFP